MKTFLRFLGLIFLFVFQGAWVNAANCPFSIIARAESSAGCADGALVVKSKSEGTESTRICKPWGSGIYRDNTCRTETS